MTSPSPRCSCAPRPEGRDFYAAPKAPGGRVCSTCFLPFPEDREVTPPKAQPRADYEADAQRFGWPVRGGGTQAGKSAELEAEAERMRAAGIVVVRAGGKEVRALDERHHYPHPNLEVRDAEGLRLYGLEVPRPAFGEPAKRVEVKASEGQPLEVTVTQPEPPAPDASDPRFRYGITEEHHSRPERVARVAREREARKWRATFEELVDGRAAAEKRAVEAEERAASTERVAVASIRELEAKVKELEGPPPHPLGIAEVLSGGTLTDILSRAGWAGVESLTHGSLVNLHGLAFALAATPAFRRYVRAEVSGAAVERVMALEAKLVVTQYRSAHAEALAIEYGGAVGISPGGVRESLRLRINAGPPRIVYENNPGPAPELEERAVLDGGADAGPRLVP
jgi:hypothetical protein